MFLTLWFLVGGIMIKSKRKIIDVLIIFFIFIITIVSLLQIKNIKIDSSAEVFVPKKNPIKIINEEISDEFGISETMIFGIETTYDSILEPENLEMIREITKKLEKLPGIKKVISLANIDYIESSPEGMVVTPLLDEEEIDYSEFRQRLFNWHEMYYDTVVSEDHTLSAFVIQTDKSSTEEQRSYIYEYMQETAKEYENNNITFSYAGQPVLKKEISRSIFQDLKILIPLVALVIVFVLIVSFKKFEGVVFPLISLIVSCMLVVGIIGLFKITFTMATLLVPILLLVVGSAYGIHMMAHFNESVRKRKNWITYEELNLILKKVSNKIRVSVILAGVTTAAGFLSQLFSPLGPFRTFGALCALGIFFALLSTFIVIPALIRLRYPKGLDPKKYYIKEKAESKSWIHGLDIIVTKGKFPILLVACLIIGVTILLLPKIVIGTNLIEFFSSDSKMVKDTNMFNEKLNGTGTMSLVIQSPEKGGVLSVDFLKQLESFEKWLPREVSQVSNVQSLIPGIKRINMVMNADKTPYEKVEEEEPQIDFFGSTSLWGVEENYQEETNSEDIIKEETALSYSELSKLFDEALLKNANGTGKEQTVKEFVKSFDSIENINGEAFNEIPYEKEKYGLETKEELNNLISQYMILYSGSLDMMLNDPLEPDQTLITIRLTDESCQDVKIVEQKIKDYWDYNLPDNWTYKIAGSSTFNIVLMDLVSDSQIISLSISLLIVWLIMIILFKSFKTGTIGMIPVFFALAGIFSFMVILGFHLDIITSLLAALAVGVGVDYSIHFMTAYQREILNEKKRPLIRVYKTTGRAIVFNASSVALGFLCLLGSNFIPIRQLGILFAVSMAFAAFAALIILPIVMNLLKRPFGKKIYNEPKEEITQ